jgi:hypothetical protein
LKTVTNFTSESFLAFLMKSYVVLYPVLNRQGSTEEVLCGGVPHEGVSNANGPLTQRREEGGSISRFIPRLQNTSPTRLPESAFVQ